MDIVERTEETREGTETAVFDILFSWDEIALRPKMATCRVSLEWSSARELWGKLGDALQTRKDS